MLQLTDCSKSLIHSNRGNEMNVTGVYFNDAMLRQISEGIKINNVDEDSLINSKNEWNYFQIPRAIVTHGRVIPAR